MSFCRSLLRFSAFTCLGSLLFSLPAIALAPAVHHPLDALTPAEYWVVYKAVREAGHTEEKTLFSSVLLHEPDKSYVLAWQPGTPIERKADVVLYYKGHSYAALVNISTAKVESFEELKGMQAPFTTTEEQEVNEAIKHDNPEMTDEQIAYTISKLKEYGIVDSGDTLKLGIGAMTDARIKDFYESMVKAGVEKPGLDYMKGYTLRFVDKGVGLELRPK